MSLRHLAVVAVVGSSLILSGRSAADEPERHARSPDAILADLKAGNERFAAGKATRPHGNVKRVKETATGQAPEAIVLGCSDSRVPPELVFDEGIGDLFIVRVAGNVAEEHTIGSMEYAAEHLHVPLLVVLGHHDCGAVKATLEASGPVEGNVGALIRGIRPAADEARRVKAPPEGLVNETVHLHAKKQAWALLVKSPVLTHLVEERKLKVVSAVYDLATGRIEWGEEVRP